jgi:Tfp pilus assembly protein PilV
MQRPNKKNTQSGYSLIEVVISLFMITVIVVLYASALNMVAISRRLRYENIAYHIATKQMETLRDITHDSLPTSGTISDPLLSQIPSGAGSFTVSDYAGYSNMKEMSVTVTWIDPVSKQVNLKSLSGTGVINP